MARLSFEGTLMESWIERNKRTYDGTAGVNAHIRSELKPTERIVLDRYFKAPGRILDVGCGTGRTSDWLSRAGLTVDAIDFAPAMIDAAKQRYPGSPVRFAVGDARRLDFPDRTFDYALFSFNGLDDIHPESDRIRALNEIRRVLVPGGIFAFSAHNATCIPRSWETVRYLWRTVRRGHIAPYRLEHHPFGDLLLYNISPFAQRRQLAANGLEPIAIVTECKVPRLAAFRDPYPTYVCRRDINSA